MLKKSLVRGLLILFLGAVVVLGTIIGFTRLNRTPKEDDILHTLEEDDGEENVVLEKESVDIFDGGKKIDLGSKIVAYRVPNSWETDSLLGDDSHFTGDYYIAIQVDDMEERNAYGYDEILYLPDIYGIITQMKLKESGKLYIRYKESVEGNEKEVWIPLYFASGNREVIEMDSGRRKGVFCEQDGLRDGESELPQIVWTKSFWNEDGMYEIEFERISPMYYLPKASVNIYADYCLIVKDENGDVISDQTIIVNFPVCMEEVCWFVDFSKDGFMDIAFCLDSYHAGKNAFDELHTLIWNPETKLFEEKDFPSYPNIWWLRRSFPLWNEEMASIIFFTFDDMDEDPMRMEMYSFFDGEWKRIRRLLVAYAEEEYTEEGEPVYLGIEELVYSEDGEVLEENLLERNPEIGPIWFDKESVWSRHNTENLKLYPESPEWKWIDAEVNGMELSKYVLIN